MFASQYAVREYTLNASHFKRRILIVYLWIRYRHNIKKPATYIYGPYSKFICLINQSFWNHIRSGNMTYNLCIFSKLSFILKIHDMVKVQLDDLNINISFEQATMLKANVKQLQFLQLVFFFNFSSVSMRF